MKFNYKSRKGFTLIELLVVIGILAVLAAIAIPSVAGLIDRANVSADNTNANEMTNAMERFVSEYELFRQDIASGTFDVNNMDAAQGRVYNVTGADTIEEIRQIEETGGLNGIRLDIDTKYALNGETARKIIKNYSKTSTSTFEPKQSDMTYWYNKVNGYTIVASKSANVDELFDKLPSDAKTNNPILTVTSWVDLGENVDMPDIEVKEMRAENNFNNTDKYAIIFRITCPNPNKYNIDLSKLRWISIVGEYRDFDMSNKQFYNFMSNASVNVEYKEDTISFDVHFTFNDDNNKTRFSHIRICYEYEEDGETKYLYSPIVSVCYNDLT